MYGPTVGTAAKPTPAKNARPRRKKVAEDAVIVRSLVRAAVARPGAPVRRRARRCQRPMPTYWSPVPASACALSRLRASKMSVPRICPASAVQSRCR